MSDPTRIVEFSGDVVITGGSEMKTGRHWGDIFYSEIKVNLEKRKINYETGRQHLKEKPSFKQWMWVKCASLELASVKNFQLGYQLPTFL